jgi:hypothetical protein
MKFKDILITIFLMGLLVYAACHRAGWVGDRNRLNEVSLTHNLENTTSDSIKFKSWIFYSHPETGLTISNQSGDILHHLPQFRSSTMEILAKPDTTGNSLGLVYILSEPGVEIPRFRILPDGLLEKTSS